MNNQSRFIGNKQNKINSASISRLDFLKKISFSLGVLMTSCTPVKILLNTHEDKYDEDNNLKSKILKAFTSSIVPGADLTNPDLCKIFCDEYYSFHKYTGFFISDLCDKSSKLFGADYFYELPFKQKKSIILAGLNDDSTTARIYTSGIFIAQVSVYCSIYDDDRGCNLIDY